MIFVTSDAHFCHDKDFVWQARGYKNVDEMNQRQVEKWNAVVSPEDEVWFLGDGMMNDNAKGAELFAQLNGKIHIVAGNHDTSARIEIYQNLGFDVQDAKRLKYKKKSFILTHEPMITSNGAFKSWGDTVNIHGHTHQTSNFTEGYHLMYHAGVDSHNGYPVSLDDVIEEMNAHWKNLEMGV